MAQLISSTIDTYLKIGLGQNLYKVDAVEIVRNQIMGALGALERNPERLGQIINFRDVSQSVLVVPISGAPILTCILHTTRVHLSMHATNRDQ